MRVTRGIFCAFALGLSLTSCGAPAFAEEPCGQATKIVEALEKMDQHQVGGGLVNPAVIVVIYATPDGSDWTALSMGTDGSACLLASGTQWFGGLPEHPVEGERGA